MGLTAPKTVNKHRHVTPPMIRLNSLNMLTDLPQRWGPDRRRTGPRLFAWFARSLNGLYGGQVGSCADADSHRGLDLHWKHGGASRPQYGSATEWESWAVPIGQHLSGSAVG